MLRNVLSKGGSILKTKQNFSSKMMRFEQETKQKGILSLYDAACASPQRELLESSSQTVHRPPPVCNWSKYHMVSCAMFLSRRDTHDFRKR
uniref:Uncharacterized protein n=2 Tax=Anguilla anguilla TaxID=7936 RepID=A0A0E9QXK1_ANGAN